MVNPPLLLVAPVPALAKMPPPPRFSMVAVLLAAGMVKVVNRTVELQMAKLVAATPLPMFSVPALRASAVELVCVLGLVMLQLMLAVPPLMVKVPAPRVALASLLSARKRAVLTVSAPVLPLLVPRVKVPDRAAAPLTPSASSSVLTLNVPVSNMTVPDAVPPPALSSPTITVPAMTVAGADLPPSVKLLGPLPVPLVSLSSVMLARAAPPPVPRMETDEVALADEAHTRLAVDLPAPMLMVVASIVLAPEPS